MGHLAHLAHQVLKLRQGATDRRGQVVINRRCGVNEVSSSSKKRGPSGRLGAVAALLALVVVAVLGLSAPSGAQYNAHPTCRVSPASVAPGGTVTVVAEGFQPGSIVSFSIDRVRSTRAPIGQATANAEGTATAQLTIPSELEDGTYTITCSGVDADGAAVAVASDVRVDSSTGGSGGTDGNGGDPGSDDLARTGSNSGALARIAVLLVAGGAALLLFGRKRSQRGSTVS